jgi:hypothetical protein
MRVRVRWLARLVAAAGTAGVVGGTGITGTGCEVPSAPSNARQMAALPTYASWWHEAQECSGLTGDLQQVDWFVVPADGDGGFWCEDGPDHTCAGEWVAPHAIYLAGPGKAYPQGYAVDEWTVKHEMLHDLVGQPGHPDVFDECHLASRTPDGVFGLGHR